MNELDERRLTEILHDHVPNPAFSVDLNGVWTSTQVHRRLTVRGPLASVAAVLLVAAGIVYVTGSSGKSPHPAAPLSSTASSPMTVAQAAANRILAAAPVLSHSHDVTSSPVPALAQPFIANSDDPVDSVRWTVASGSAASAIAYFIAHPPAGFSTPSTDTEGARAGVLTRSLVYVATDISWLDPSAYRGLQLTVTVAGYHGGVAVRTDAQASWIPAKSAHMVVPMDAISAEVTLVRPDSAPTVHKTLNQSEARRVAALINSQVVASAARRCGNSIGDVDELTFRASRTTVNVVVQVDGCEVITLSGQSPSQSLDGSLTVNSVLVDYLKLGSLYAVP